MLGVNPESDIVYFINRLSPVEAARGLWKIDEIDRTQLPALRSSSDIAWGMWNRMMHGANIKNI